MSRFVSYSTARITKKAYEVAIVSLSPLKFIMHESVYSSFKPIRTYDN
jgi:hypothetical protein